MWAVRHEINTLTHYGVKGMKWGVRKEYEPKGSPIKSNKEEEAIKAAEKYNKMREKEKNTTRESKWTTVLQTDKAEVKFTDYGEVSRDYYKKKLADRDIKTIAEYASDEVAQERFDALPKHDGGYKNVYQQSLLVNRGDAPNATRNINCFQCVLAYEMRHRGYDVQSKEIAGGGYSYEAFHAFDVKDYTVFSVSERSGVSLTREERAQIAYDEMQDKCLSYGDYARGLVGVRWPTGGGHAMMWIVENGEFKIIDPQHGGKDGKESFLECEPSILVEVMRLDNAEALPGVTDFVEPFEGYLVDPEEEKKKAEEEKKKEEFLEDRSSNPTDTKGKKLAVSTKRKAPNTLRTSNVSSQKKTGQSAVRKAIDKIGKTTKKAAKTIAKYVKDGAKAVESALKKLTQKVKAKLKHGGDTMDEIMHYGVLGMKWGVRRTPEQLGHKPTFKEGHKRRKLQAQYKASVKNTQMRYRMGQTDERRLKAREKDYNRSLRKVVLPWNKEKKDKELALNDRRLRDAVERMKISKENKERAYDIMLKREKEVLDYVDSLNQKYGAENIKQVRYKENVAAGEDWVINKVIRTGVTTRDLPVIGGYLNAKDVARWEKEYRDEVIEEEAKRKAGVKRESRTTQY